MYKIDKSRFFTGLILIFSFWVNFLSRGDYCLRAGGGTIICGHFATITMTYVTLGGLYLIYRSFKK